MAYQSNSMHATRLIYWSCVIKAWIAYQSNSMHATRLIYW